MSTDLRQKANALRERFPDRSRATPPPDTSKRLATFARPKDRAELRVSWAEYEGRPFLSLRIWTRADDGGWWPSKQGATIRVAELADFADAVGEALDLAVEHRDAEAASHQRPQPRPQPPSRPDAPAARRPRTPVPDTGDGYGDF